MVSILYYKIKNKLHKLILKFRKIQLNITYNFKIYFSVITCYYNTYVKKSVFTKCDSLKNNIKNNNKIKEKFNFNNKKTFFQ